MVFSSLEFLFFFLPLVFIVYILIKPGIANLWLLIASLAFYYVGDRQHIYLLVSIITVAYFSGILLEKFSSKSGKRFLCCCSLGVMAGIMAYFKYWDFLIKNVNEFFGRNMEVRGIILPIGISFFTFQAISYVIDVYRGENALKNPVDMGLYISFFPQLIAGPIVRFHDISEYMDKKYREINIENIENGIWRFCIGLSKKVLLANNLGGLADLVFGGGGQNITEFSVLYTWLGAIAYTLQIYYDFSGYSDMAIGLGNIFGFRFRENFNYPYVADSVKGFWRRWHMSLSQFFRDYVYIPLGGNRCSKIRWIFNVLAVWFLTGLWHGAAWNYILWGMSYGIILLIENLFRSKRSGRLISMFNHVYTMLAVVLLWVVFRANDLSQAKEYIKNMFGMGSARFIDQGFVFQTGNFAVLLMISVIFSLPVSELIENKAGKFLWFQWGKTFLLICCVVASVSYIYMGSYNPFLYFMF